MKAKELNSPLYALELGDGELCIGGGYGMSADSKAVKVEELATSVPPEQREMFLELARNEIANGGHPTSNLEPESHRDIFRVRVAPIGGWRSEADGDAKSGGVGAGGEACNMLAAREVDRMGRGWAWNMHAHGKLPMVMTEVAYGSPTLRIASRTPEVGGGSGSEKIEMRCDPRVESTQFQSRRDKTESPVSIICFQDAFISLRHYFAGDFWPRDDAGSTAVAGPSADEVGNGGDAITGSSAGSMFGRRVKIFGLKAAGLNGKQGRVGSWDPKKGRYMVSLNRGLRVVAVKPDKLRLLPAVPVESISDVFSNHQSDLGLLGQPKVSLFKVIMPGQNMGETLNKGTSGSARAARDIYRGPISAEAMAILECVGMSQDNANFYAINHIPREIFNKPPGTAAAAERLDKDRQFHRFLVRESDVVHFR